MRCVVIGFKPNPASKVKIATVHIPHLKLAGEVPVKNEILEGQECELATEYRVKDGRLTAHLYV